MELCKPCWWRLWQKIAEPQGREWGLETGKNGPGQMSSRRADCARL
jgi:hypothetical protein